MEDSEKDLLTMNEYSFFEQLFSIRKLDKGAILKSIGTNKNLTDCDLQSLFCEPMLLNDEDHAKRDIIRSVFEELFQHHGLKCKLYSFGSSTSGLGTYDSDIDFHVRVLDRDGKPVLVHNHSNESNKLLLKIAKILNSTMQVFFFVKHINAKVCPIVKMEQRKRRHHLVSMDLNVSNPFGIYNSIFINFLCQFSPRFRMLCTILRHWAKLNNIIFQNGGINSYTLTMLVIFFLQSGQAIFKPIEMLGVNFHEHYLSTDPDEFKQIIYSKCKALVQDANNDYTVLELLKEFFVFYATFDYQCFVISPLKGQAFRKDDFVRMVAAQNGTFQLHSGLCVQDPFELERNLVTKYVRADKLDAFIHLCQHYQTKAELYFRNGVNFRSFLEKPNNAGHVSGVKRLMPCACFLQTIFRDDDAYIPYGIRAPMPKLIEEFVPFVCRKITEAFSPSRVFVLSEELKVKLSKLLLAGNLTRPSGKNMLTVATLYLEVCFTPNSRRKPMKRRRDQISAANGDPLQSVPEPEEEMVEDEDEFQLDLGVEGHDEEVLHENNTTTVGIGQRMRVDSINNCRTTIAQPSHRNSSESRSARQNTKATGNLQANDHRNSTQTQQRFIPKKLHLDCVFRGDHFFFLSFYDTRDGPHIGPLVPALCRQTDKILCSCD